MNITACDIRILRKKDLVKGTIIYVECVYIIKLLKYYLVGSLFSPQIVHGYCCLSVLYFSCFEKNIRWEYYSHVSFVLLLLACSLISYFIFMSKALVIRFNMHCFQCRCTKKTLYGNCFIKAP